jgi:beta-glucosidase/6-phospho-beta-glucosidase/beta-galactosidase
LLPHITSPCRRRIIHCITQYGNGDFAPGIQYGDSGKWKCGHHLLLAHANAVKVFRQKYNTDKKGRIGMALWSEWSEPWTDKFEGEKFCKFTV